jgi:hypothetical protein
VELKKTRTEILKELGPNFEPDSSKTPTDPTKSATAHGPQSKTPPDLPHLHDADVEAISDFTPRAKQVLALARKEANRLNHGPLGTEHVLLGLIALGQGVAVNALARLGLDLETARQDVEKLDSKRPEQKLAEDIAYTPGVKRAFALAHHEKKALNHTYLGTEHILLGLLREGDGAAAKIMKERGIDLAELRAEILRELAPKTASPFSDKNAEQPQTEPLRDWLSRYIKPDPVDLTKRYDVYCTRHGQSVVYRNVLFKSVKGLLQDHEADLQSIYIELELIDGKSVFLPKIAVFKFADPGAAAEGDPVPPSKTGPPGPQG